MEEIRYSRRILEGNPKVYVDTSVLMDIEGLKLFICNIENDLLDLKKKITVPKAVWMELARHSQSENFDKREKANIAIKLIKERDDIFFIEDRNIDPEMIWKAFADKELLSRIMQNKTYYGQLLITNDKKLSKDAYNLNAQESCLGYKISVCYVSKEGNLNAYECVMEDRAPLKEVEIPIIQCAASKKSSCLGKVITASGISLGIGILLGKYGARIVSYII